MNQEKIQVLFEQMVVAADELRKATAAATQIKVANNKEQHISKLINDFKAIQGQMKDLDGESSRAIAVIKRDSKAFETAAMTSLTKVEKAASLPKIITMIVVILFCATIGLVAGYFATVPAYKLITETKYDIGIREGGIVLPHDFRDRLRKTSDGSVYLAR